MSTSVECHRSWKVNSKFLSSRERESTARGEDDKHKRKLYKHNPVLIHQLSHGQIQGHIYQCRDQTCTAQWFTYEAFTVCERNVCHTWWADISNLCKLAALFSAQTASLLFKHLVLDKHFSDLYIFTVLSSDKQQSPETTWTQTQDQHWNLSVVILAIQSIFSVPSADSSKVSENGSASLTEIQAKISFPC